MKKKNIAILTPSLGNGGAERVAGLLSKSLSEYYNVYIFIDDIENIIYDFSGELIHIAKNGQENLFSYVKELKEQLEIDCCISFLTTYNIINVLTKRHEFVVVTEHSAPSRLSEIDRKRVRELYPYADKVVCVSHGMQKEFTNVVKLEGANLCTIYNFINKERILEQAEYSCPNEVLDFTKDSQVVLTVGRLHKLKNFEKLIYQFSLLKKERENLKLLIIGSGEEERYLSCLVYELGLTQDVKFVNYTSNPFRIYKQADIFVLTSDLEGFSLAIFEAMLLKVPVVSVDCKVGPRELLTETCEYKSIKGYEICKNGILVEQAESDTRGTTDNVKQAVELVLNNSKLRNQIVQNGYEYALNYDNEKILLQWLGIIESPHRLVSVEGIQDKSLLEAERIVIYGAGVRGKQILSFLKLQGIDLAKVCFAVTKKTNSLQGVCGVPVYEIEDLIEYKQNVLVLIGVSVKYESEVVSLLEKYEFNYTYTYI